MADSGDPLPVGTSGGKSIVDITASDLDSPGDVRGEFEDGRSEDSAGSNILAVGDRRCDVDGLDGRSEDSAGSNTLAVGDRHCEAAGGGFGGGRTENSVVN